MTSLTEFWDKFLKDNKLPDSTPFGGELAYADESIGSVSGITGTNGNEDIASVLSLILGGKKTANFSALAGYHIDNEPLPHKSQYYVLNDWTGNHVAVIKTVNVQVIPFDEIPWEMAQKEGADENLDGFRQRYTEFFKEDADLMGYDYSQSMPVVFEEFVLVWKAL